MTTPAQTLPMATGHRDEVSDTVPGSTTSPANGTDGAPTLPQRPIPAHPQPLPQPFHNQNQPVYIPYTGQPNQQPPYATPIRPLPHQSSAYLATRLGLTALASVWGIIIVALTSILLSQGGTAANVSLYAYIIVGISILWNTSELITYCVRLRSQTQRGIHPGAHVGLHLLFWLAGIFAVLLTVSLYVSVSASVRHCENRDNDDDDYYSYFDNSYCSEYQPLDYYKGHVLPVFRALVGIFVLWAINHFVLFVLACIETHKRNALRSATFIMPPQALNAIPAQGVYYPPQAGTQLMQPIQYYPYPIMMQPQPTPVPGVESRSQIANEKQSAPISQNIAGFYAPALGPLVGASSNNASASSPPRNME